MLFRALLLTVAVSAFGQSLHQALKDALWLTEMQIWQHRQEKPAAIASRGTASSSRALGVPSGNLPMDYSASLQRALENPILDASQQAKLAGIVKVLDRWRAASEVMAMGLIATGEWPWSTCLPYPLRAFASEFDLSDAQVEQLERLQRAAQEPLWAQIREKAMASELLDSKSPAAVRFTADISKLSQQLAAIRPPRDHILAVLNEGQRANIAAFELDLELVREAIEIKLIPDPPKGEDLCQ
jgi:hypothetical protein